MARLEDLANSIISGKADAAVEATEGALADGTPAAEILTDGLIAGMQVVGERFKNHEFYVPEVLIAARAMKMSMAKLRPHLVEQDYEPVGTVAIGTVRGDLHDIGKNLVAMMLEGAGFAIMDLGIDVTPEQFVQAVKDGADMIALSALLTTTMPAMKDTVEALDAAGIRDQVKVIIGGAPVTETYANEIGADGYGPDAASGAELARELVAA
ncbi:corrinoid protein [Candidatus Poribacteria bacterium]|mgnify:CR=1 FL=1|jgi:5-methyltetrahydrofolate--homocysteine methyltransferase|nr:corrinoid protein [Candidatus Poribacteria bacterium]MBT5531503.1 corrinoid protein [Candidatus Poribacteria bacterium]MBT5714568.1 corrinoid protein [Candidatus Poribacteria bacterium]MBT7098708.1 corrinoid protein [Candidatus Poribacteria bacterium]MBT7804838.1 corrinoid protein [Candidatus Poribacteria bacterium]